MVGSSIMLVGSGVTLVMLYLAGMSMRYIALGLLAALPVLGYMLFFVPWRLARMRVFLNPDADPRGTGFHILQSHLAGDGFRRAFAVAREHRQVRDFQMLEFVNCPAGTFANLVAKEEVARQESVLGH